MSILLRVMFIALLEGIASLGSNGIPAFAQQSPITSSADFNCVSDFPSHGSIVDLATGKGVGLLRVDNSKDVLPPCVGSPPQTPPPMGGEYPLSMTLPQLAKIKTDQGECSANLIAANAVITAAHCIFDLKTQRYATGVRVIPGYQRGQSDYPSFTGVTALTFTGYTSAKISGHDVAVVKFGPSTLEHKFNPYGLTAFNVQTCKLDPTLLKKEYFEPHYSPAIGGNQVQAGAEGLITNCVQGMIQTLLPLGPGSSGSAVVARFSRAIFAVHSQYNSSASFNAVITEAKICTIHTYLDGLSQTPDCFIDN
jgi:hypothetical protein